MGCFSGPKVESSQLTAAFDAGNAKSYVGIGTTWNDLSGRSNTGALTYGPTYNSADGGAIVFDGSNDCVVVNSNASVLSNTAYTKTVWFYVTSFATNNNLISGGNNGRHVFWLAGTNKLQAGHNSTWNTISSTTSLSLNTWYHAAVTFSTTTGWCLYLNGVLDSTNSSTSTVFSAYDVADALFAEVSYGVGYGATTTFLGSGEILLGGYGTGSNAFSGRISNAFVYNRVLSASEIQQNYNALRIRYRVYGILAVLYTTPPSAISSLTTNGTEMVYVLGQFAAASVVYKSSSPYTSWTSYSAPVGDRRYTIIYLNGVYFISGAVNSAAFYRSTDAINWTLCNISGNPNSTTSSFVYNSARSEWVTGGGSWVGTNCVRKSTDGLNFSLTYTYPSGTSGSTILATSSLDNAYAYMYWMTTSSDTTLLSVARSQNAATWTESNWIALNGSSSTLRFLEYFNGRYWACNGNNVLGTTTDGLTWTNYSNANLDFQMIYAGSFTYGLTTYSYISGSNAFALSTDGTTWTKYTHSFSTLYNFNSIGSQIYATNGTSIYTIWN
jgi:hypothetical protein